MIYAKLLLANIKPNVNVEMLKLSDQSGAIWHLISAEMGLLKRNLTFCSAAEFVCYNLSSIRHIMLNSAHQK
jgi:hypothetical protein